MIQGLLSSAAYIQIADALRADPNFMRAVAMIESAESADALRYEKHIWRRYRFASREAKKFDRKSNPRTMAKRWANFEAMDAVARRDGQLFNPAADKAAIYAHSFGAWQIMGFNHKACGFESPRQFLKTMKTVEGQIQCLVGFIEGDRTLLQATQTRDILNFSYHYNGRLYHKNKYDVKLQRAYQKAMAEPIHV